jgi:hypothetical protein
MALAESRIKERLEDETPDVDARDTRNTAIGCRLEELIAKRGWNEECLTGKEPDLGRCSTRTDFTDARPLDGARGVDGSRRIRVVCEE